MEEKVQKPLITGPQLVQIYPSMGLARATGISLLLNKYCMEFGIIGEDFKIFLAQCIHESGGFAPKRESTNYSAQGMANTWPSRYSVDPKAKIKVPNALAKSLARNPEAIANNAYANRMGNGNESSGDGYRFRGGGLLQTTGADMYRRCGKAIGVNLYKIPDLILDDDVACKSACWLYAVEKKCLGKSLLQTTVLINGGTIGLKKREEMYDKIKKIL